MDIFFDALDITEQLVYFSLEYISRSSHAHSETIILGFPKFSNYCCHILTSGRKPYSIVSRFDI